MRKGVGVTHNVFGDLDRIARVRGWSFKYECSIQATGCEPARWVWKHTESFAWFTWEGSEVRTECFGFSL